MSMSYKKARSKIGLIDKELNFLSKCLFLMMTILSLILTVSGFISKFDGWNYDDIKNMIVIFVRFILLLSYILPISLRVNLDFAKLYYSYVIHNDN